MQKWRVGKGKLICCPRYFFEIYLNCIRYVYIQTLKGYYYLYNEKEDCLKRISATSFFEACERYKGY